MGINGEINFLLVSDRVIHQYNKRYLQHDYATDVLAFEGGGEISGKLPFGDIMISTDTAARQAKEEGHSFERELKILAIHGILHLLGYRDKHKKDYVKMWKKTYQLLEGE